MLPFRTVLLWLAFVLLLLQYFIDPRENFTLGLLFRLSPTALLLLWFIVSVFFRSTLQLDALKTPKPVIRSLVILRPMASISIVLGALLKIMHWPGGNMLLLWGIGIMAIYSTILSRYAYDRPEKNPEIIDDLDEE